MVGSRLGSKLSEGAWLKLGSSLTLGSSLGSRLGSSLVLGSRLGSRLLLGSLLGSKLTVGSLLMLGLSEGFKLGGTLSLGKILGDAVSIGALVGCELARGLGLGEGLGVGTRGTGACVGTGDGRDGAIVGMLMLLISSSQYAESWFGLLAGGFAGGVYDGFAGWFCKNGGRVGAFGVGAGGTGDCG